MGSRRRKRNVWPLYNNRWMKKKLPATATPEECMAFLARKQHYFQLLRRTAGDCWAREELLRDPAHWPRVPNTRGGIVPNGWKTVWYTGYSRKKKA